MLRKIVICIFALSFTAVGWSADIKFDQGVDIKSITETSLQNIGENDFAVPELKGRYTHDSYYDRDCVRFVFKPNSPLKSNKVKLLSVEYITECHLVITHPNGGTSEYCHTRLGHTYSKWAQIEITDDRKLLPWEEEEFEICLEGRWSQLYEWNTAYYYLENQSYHGHDSIYKLTPVDKKATKPDKTGINLDSFTIEDGKDAKNIKLVFHDKWAKYYKGEKTQITVKLIRDRFFDSVVYKENYEFKSATAYEIQFPKELKRGKYYVKWGFKRIGEVSTQKYMRGNKTARVEVK